MRVLQQCYTSLCRSSVGIKSAKCTGFTSYRHFSTTRSRNLKEISIKTDGNKTVVEGILIQSPRTSQMIEDGKETHLCPACPHRLGTEIRYTDVLILSQFLQPDGKILSRTITGLCNAAHYKMRKNVEKAQLAGLLPGFKPDHPDGTEDNSAKNNKYTWAKYNTYFEDGDWE